MPKIDRSTHTVSQSVLLSTGEVSIVQLDERFAPHSTQPARIENLCGYYLQYFDDRPFKQLINRNRSCFGRQRELFHLEGNLTINQGRASFMGGRSFAGLTRLGRTMRLENPSFAVHMVVICLKLGRRAHVTSHGLMESNISRWDRYLRVEGRMFELCNTVRFTVKAFEGEFALDPAIRPDNNDWAITGKGTVIARLTWVRLVWTAEAEAGILAFANKVGEWLKECCGDLSPASAD